MILGVWAVVKSRASVRFLPFPHLGVAKPSVIPATASTAIAVAVTQKSVLMLK